MTPTAADNDRRPEDLLPLTHVVYHLLIALVDEDRHGYAIIKDVLERTAGRVEIEAGTLYAAIKRLREDGLIVETPPPADADARRRYYRITPFGKRVLHSESRRLEEMVELARDVRVLPTAPR